MKKCPHCAEEIQDEAIKCRHCGEKLEQIKKSPKITKMTRKDIRIAIGSVIFGLIVLGIFGSFLSDEDSKKSNQSKSVKSSGLKLAKARYIESLSPEEAIKHSVTIRFKRDFKRISTIDVQPKKGGKYTLTIEYVAKENFTNNLTREGMIRAAMSMTEKMLKESSMENVRMLVLKPYLPLTDQYGNERISQVGKFFIPRSLAAKINWKNMRYNVDGFVRLLKRNDRGSYWMHPALRG